LFLNEMVNSDWNHLKLFNHSGAIIKASLSQWVGNFLWPVMKAISIDSWYSLISSKSKFHAESEETIDFWKLKFRLSGRFFTIRHKQYKWHSLQILRESILFKRIRMATICDAPLHFD
jgi:hypothetical protein